jgi:hypothetical protein
VEREACRQNAAANEGRLEPAPESQDLCEQRLAECPDPAADDSANRTQLCEELESNTERKLACGLTADAPAQP